MVISIKVSITWFLKISHFFSKKYPLYISFLGLPYKVPQAEWSKTTKINLSYSRTQKPENKVLANGSLVEDVRKKLFHTFLYILVFSYKFGVHWQLNSNLCFSIHMPFASVSVSSHFSTYNCSHWI